MSDIEELREAIRRLKLRNETGNKDYDNCLRWLGELLIFKEGE